MTPYFIAFCISIISTYFAQKVSRGLQLYILSFFAVAPLILLAAYRDYSVGTDTINYMSLFNSAIEFRGNYDQYIDTNPSFEKAFLTYNYILAHFTSSVEVYFAITYSIIIGLFYASAFRLRKYISPTVFMLIFMLLFYSESLNIMRQYISVAFVMWAVTNLITGKTFKYIIWVLVASLFHTSAIVAFIIGALYYISKRFPFKQNINKYFILCALMLAAGYVMQYIPNISILEMAENKLRGYIDSTEIGSISNSHLALCIATAIYLLCTHKEKPFYSTTLLTTIYTLALFVSPYMNAALYRITIYYLVMFCFAISYTYKNSSTIMQTIFTVLILIIYAGFYTFSFVISGAQQVVPYTSKILESSI